VLILLQGAGEEVENDLAAHATAVALEGLPPERVRRWIDHRAGQLGITIEPAAADLLLAAVGSDLGAVSQELEKLAGVAQGRAVSTDDLGAVAGVRQGETVQDLVAHVLRQDAARAAQLVAPVLEQAGVSGVRIITALGAALIGTAIARAELDRGTPASRVAAMLYNHIQTARPQGLGSWRDTAARWTEWAAQWRAADLRRALRLALAADKALKSPTVSDEGGIVLDLVLRLGVPAEVVA
jgi:DNA polymerase-3 subunit delta